MPAVTNDPQAILLRYPEAAARLSLSRWTLYDLVKKGDLPVVKIGRSRRISVEALTEFARRMQEGTAHVHTA